MKVFKLIPVAALLLVSASPVFADVVYTYEFTGIITNDTGAYSPYNGAIVGTFTIDYGNAIPTEPQNTGVIGSPTGWTSESESGSQVSQRPTPSPLIYTETVTQGTTTIFTTAPTSPLFNGAYINATTQTNPQTGTFSLYQETHPTGNSISDSSIEIGSNDSLPWTSDGVPIFANANEAVGTIQVGSSGQASQLEFNITGLTEVSAVSPTPLPRSAWMMLSGLILFGFLARLRKNGNLTRPQSV
jgi:hypothetical protein